MKFVKVAHNDDFLQIMFFLQDYYQTPFLQSQSKFWTLPGNRLKYGVIVHCVHESPVSW